MMAVSQGLLATAPSAAARACRELRWPSSDLSPDRNYVAPTGSLDITLPTSRPAPIARQQWSDAPSDRRRRVRQSASSILLLQSEKYEVAPPPQRRRTVGAYHPGTPGTCPDAPAMAAIRVYRANSTVPVQLRGSWNSRLCQLARHSRAPALFTRSASTRISTIPIKSISHICHRAGNAHQICPPVVAPTFRAHAETSRCPIFGADCMKKLYGADQIRRFSI